MIIISSNQYLNVDFHITNLNILRNKNKVDAIVKYQISYKFYYS